MAAGKCSSSTYEPNRAFIITETVAGLVGLPYYLQSVKSNGLLLQCLFGLSAAFDQLPPCFYTVSYNLIAYEID